MVSLPGYRIIIDCDQQGKDVRTWVQCVRPCGGLSVGVVMEMTGIKIARFDHASGSFVDEPPTYRAVMFHTHGGEDRIDFVKHSRSRADLFDITDLYATQIQAVPPHIAHGKLWRGVG